MRVMLDSNVFDTLVAEDTTLDAYRHAVSLRRIEPFTTPIQEEQLALAPVHKRKQFARVPRTVVPAESLPVSAAAKPGRLADLIIGQTATTLQLVLVTDDRLLRDTLRAQSPAPVVWSAAELLRYLGPESLPRPNSS